MADVRELQAFAESRQEAFTEDLRAMVDIDCGSYSPAGVNAIADRCERRFVQDGWIAERRPHIPADGEPQLGDLVIGRIGGGSGPRVLLIGHMDTVFDDGTAAARPFRIVGNLAYGPGTSDMKGGLLAGFEAVSALRRTGASPAGTVTYVCNPDEEIGSPFSGPVIRELADEHDVALVLECARANGDVVSARKGVTDYAIDFVGRAAHAGVEPEKGASAVLAAAHTTVALHALNGRWPGVTVNVGVVRGGSRTNVVPERSELHLDLRSPDEASMHEAEEAIRMVCLETVVPGVELVLREHGWHRPMERSEDGGALAERAITIGKELGLEFSDTSTGGASDANTTSAAGVPTLDGLGPVGGDAHAEGEWLDLSSVPARVSLLAALIDRAGER
ncbi:MAG: M20 family metallopeptidase [Actinomycetota bacterium]